eukprot:CAMPEP_0206024100 /NCGR_PEP_ID=MMETSP1464-20131121/37642_1 /ASSEMBLY_ACC=CAM_ASM_001124 /TAXON_ID=119497 /ORGANISM="Exanthemachrysis gayraliae, Strain RCC1523" /LENGTH=227 /DNA_ID=CAMNT_0053398101 /DNA_START=33 /DNA_END=716 /DNA_ORIENTATION=-
MRSPTRAACGNPDLLCAGRAKVARVLVMRGGEDKGKGLWAKYNELLDKHPLPTKMATSAVLATLGDVIAQKLINKVAGYSFRGLGILVAVNVLYISPVLHFWYGTFEHLVTNVLKFPPGSLKSMVASVILDQLVNAPLTVLGFFCTFTTFDRVADVLARGSGSFGTLVPAIRQKIQAEYVSTMLANWKVWVLPQCLNFKVVPVNLRVGFANIVAIVWNTILSIVANR